jgi:hypothetical protein
MSTVFGRGQLSNKRFPIIAYVNGQILSVTVPVVTRIHNATTSVQFSSPLQPYRLPHDAAADLGHTGCPEMKSHGHSVGTFPPWLTSSRSGKVLSWEDLLLVVPPVGSGTPVAWVFPDVQTACCALTEPLLPLPALALTCPVPPHSWLRLCS